MSKNLIGTLERILYPYWIVARVSALVVASLLYLVLHEITRSASYEPILLRKQLVKTETY